MAGNVNNYTGLRNDIYEMSGGSFILPTGGHSSNAFLNTLEMAGSTMYNAARSATAGEQNAFYTEANRMRRYGAMISVFAGDHTNAHSNRIYRTTDFSALQASGHLSRIGMTSSANTDKMNQMLRNAQFQTKGNNAIDINPRNLTSSQKEQLRTTGTFQHNGETVSIRGQSRSDVQAVFQGAYREQQKVNSIANQSTPSNRRMTMNELKRSEISYLNKNASFNFSGSKGDVARLRRELDAKISTLRSEIGGGGLSNLEIERKTKEISKLETTLGDLKHYEETGARVKGGLSNEGKRAQGFRIMAQGVLGDEMYSNVRKYRTVNRIAKKGIMAGVKATDKSVTFLRTAPRRAGAFVNSHSRFGDKTRAKTLRDQREAILARKGKRDDAMNRLVGGNYKSRQEFLREKRKERLSALQDKVDAHNAKKLDRLNKHAKGKLSDEDLKKLKDNPEKLRRKKSQLEKNKKKNEKKLNRHQKKHEKLGAIKGGLNKAKEGAGKVLGVITKPFQVIGNIVGILRDGIVGLFRAAKKWLFILIGGAVGALVIPTIVIVLITTLIASFFSSSSTEDGTSYCQYMVNQVQYNLKRQFDQVVGYEALIHYSEKEPIKTSSNIPWYCQVEAGTVGKIWMSTEMNLPEDQRHPLASTNVNILPILSLMKYRFMEDIDNNNLSAALYYTATMYARTHDIERDSEGNYVFSYKRENDHIQVYDGPRVWNSFTCSLDTRAQELCTNIFLHGYENYNVGNDSSFAKTINKWRANLADNVRNITHVSSFGDLSANGCFLDHAPDGCDNYKIYVYSLDLNNHNTCGFDYEHKHDLSCLEKYQDPVTGEDRLRYKCAYADKPEHTHTKPQTNPDGTVISPGCAQQMYVCQGHCGGHISPTANVVVDYDWDSIAQKDDFAAKDLNAIQLGQDAKSTFAEVGDVLADLGTSMNPYLSSEMKQKIKDQSSLEDLQRQASVTIDAHINTHTTIKEWQDEWCNKLTDEAHGLFNTWAEIQLDNANRITGNETAVIKDAQGFTGWLDNTGHIKPAILSDLISLYGDWTNGYKVGVQNWWDLGKVKFSMLSSFGGGNVAGAGAVLQEEEIKAVLDKCAQTNFGLTEERHHFLMIALQRVGAFPQYELSGEAHNNAITHSGIGGDVGTGKSECSGFVSGCIVHSGLGGLTGSTPAFYNASIGSLGSTTLIPGDILVWDEGGGAHGHVVIYLGRFNENPIPSYANYKGVTMDEPGDYYVECGGNTGGGSGISNYINSARSWRVYRGHLTQ